MSAHDLIKKFITPTSDSTCDTIDNEHQLLLDQITKISARAVPMEHQVHKGKNNNGTTPLRILRVGGPNAPATVPMLVTRLVTVTTHPEPKYALDTAKYTVRLCIQLRRRQEDPPPRSQVHNSLRTLQSSETKTTVHAVDDEWKNKPEPTGP